MSKRNEKISAYLDGEVHQDELMSFSLSAESEDTATSVRYRLIGEVLRGEVSELAMQDVSVAVREALADENIANESLSGQIETTCPATGSVPIGADNGRLSTEPVASHPAGWLAAGWLRPLGGMAVAASVAVVMVLAVMQEKQPVGTQIANAQQAVPTTPVTIASNRALQSAPIQSIPVVASRRELEPYLDQHFATQGALQSRMPYVRAVSYESGE